MQKVKIYCITINNDHYDKIKKLDLIPVGLGKNIINSEFITDKDGTNIHSKNLYYGEYTFHYWLWKNKLEKLDNEWIGFCQYRKFWGIQKKPLINDNLEDFKKNLLFEIPVEFQNYDSIIGEPLYVNKFRFSKFIKKNFKKMVLNPTLLFNKEKRTIKFHFDMMHGEGNLDKAIKLLESNEQKDFTDYVNTEVCFNPHNMFICKSKKILSNYYQSVFPWLERSEKIFGFNLEGYGLQRIYGFLAERYMSYWFKKYTKYMTLPIIVKDISELD